MAGGSIGLYDLGEDSELNPKSSRLGIGGLRRERGEQSCCKFRVLGTAFRILSV